MVHQFLDNSVLIDNDPVLTKSKRWTISILTQDFSQPGNWNAVSSSIKSSVTIWKIWEKLKLCCDIMCVTILCVSRFRLMHLCQNIDCGLSLGSLTQLLKNWIGSQHSPRTSKMCCVQSDMKILRQKNVKSETVVLCRVRESNVNILSGRATFVASHGEQFELIVECLCWAFGFFVSWHISFYYTPPWFCHPDTSFIGLVRTSVGKWIQRSGFHFVNFHISDPREL
jgi:hypothetical protein